MPIYQFKDERDGRLYEFIQKMNDNHIAFAEDGHPLKRIFLNPHPQIDTKIDPMSSKEFADKTRGKNYNLGQVMDLSAEMSEKRAKKMGRDEVKEKVMCDYERKCKKPHPERLKKKNKYII
jgi:hypothetical protein